MIARKRDDTKGSRLRVKMKALFNLGQNKAEAKFPNSEKFGFQAVESWMASMDLTPRDAKPIELVYTFIVPLNIL